MSPSALPAVTPQPHVPKAGVWVPTVTFIDQETDTLDLAAQKQYYAYLATTGLAGLVVLGTNAETFLLTREERRDLIAAAREAVGPDFPLMAGVGAHSTKQVLELANDAAQAGANYLLVLPAAYFGKATTPAVVDAFFTEVAEKAPLPVVIYNFPAVSNGVDLDSDAMTRLARKSPNIVGVKLTCASVGKITRLAGSFSLEEFIVFGGQADFLMGALSVGAGGCISGFANAFPKTIARIYDLYTAGQHAEALALHRVAALAENPCKSGIAATKYAVSLHSALHAGIADPGPKLLPRRPYLPPGDEEKAKISAAMSEIAKIEATL